MPVSHRERGMNVNPKPFQVLYPGLPAFEGHSLAASQMPGGFGGMLPSSSSLLLSSLELSDAPVY